MERSICCETEGGMMAGHQEKFANFAVPIIQSFVCIVGGSAAVPGLLYAWPALFTLLH